ncbi:MAG: hypothetical protein R3343_03575 [Nitriliruptorales bacterium]|nr:hypothetical protein [Nitriliruptorales bacterium]
MSQQGPDPRQELSEEELKAYLGQLREAPLTDVVAQTVSVLLNAAQVKLGRPDGRTLIDIVAAIRDTAGDALEEGLVSELDNVLNQLRMAQVEAENQSAPAGAEPAEPVPDDTPPATGDQSGSGGASKLWTPGQS